jgi:CubicO group peptidase (beta-lactamase class C family)
MTFCALLLATIAAPPASAQSTPKTCAAPSVAAGGPSNAHTAYVETSLRPAVIKPGAPPLTLAEEMRRYDVPGISVAVIHEGKIAWARGWGLRDLASCAPVTPDTAFQAASISKVITAMIALRLVEQGRIGLDRNINAALRSWQMPRGRNAGTGRHHPSPIAEPHGRAWRSWLRSRVSARRGPPTVIQILDGAPPAGNPPVRSILPAGGQFEYSGGGYMVAQLALTDVSGLPFADLAQREVLGPLGMTRSAFAMPPSPRIRADMASGSARGKPIADDDAVLPQLAAAGLWTSAGDLARVLIDLQASAAGQRGTAFRPP